MITEEIDVIKLYSGAIPRMKNTDDWNRWLTECHNTNDLDELVKTRRGLQIGMATAQRQGLVTEQIAEMFCRWIGSIDKTIRKIVKNRNTLANDIVGNPNTTKETYAEKKERDNELEKFLKKESY